MEKNSHTDMHVEDSLDAALQLFSFLRLLFQDFLRLLFPQCIRSPRATVNFIPTVTQNRRKLFAFSGYL